MSTVSGASAADQTSTAYETLCAAVRERRLTEPQAEALLTILLHLHTAADMLDRADQRYPQYANEPGMPSADRAGVAESAIDVFRGRVEQLGHHLRE